MTSNFWHEPQAQQLLWRQRRQRTRRLRIDGEPEQKGRRGGGHRTARAQQALVEQLIERHQYPLTGPVALDVVFHSQRPQPPAVERLAKYLLDVLGTIAPQADLHKRGHVLYRDDRQVKLLYVTLSVTRPETCLSGGAQTWITARPLRDVVADLTLAGSIDQNTTEPSDDDPDSPLYVPQLPDVDYEPVFDPDVAESDDQADRWRTLNERLAVLDHTQLQEVLLRRSDAVLARLLIAIPTRINGARPPRRPCASEPTLVHAYAQLDTALADIRTLLLSGQITMPMPDLPQAKGDGQRFKAAIREAVKALVSGRPVFWPLRVPIKIVLLVVAPQQGKDLDNLALVVLPAVQHILKPPAITAYEVIELTRTADDPPQGYLRIALGNGCCAGSSWDNATASLEDHLER